MEYFFAGFVLNAKDESILVCAIEKAEINKPIANAYNGISFFIISKILVIILSTAPSAVVKVG